MALPTQPFQISLCCPVAMGSGIPGTREEEESQGSFHGLVYYLREETSGRERVNITEGQTREGSRNLEAFCPGAEGWSDLQPGDGAVLESLSRAQAVPWGWQGVDNRVASHVCQQRQCQAQQSDLDRSFSESLITFVWSPRERLEGELSADPSLPETWWAPQPSFLPSHPFLKEDNGQTLRTDASTHLGRQGHQGTTLRMSRGISLGEGALRPPLTFCQSPRSSSVPSVWRMPGLCLPHHLRDEVRGSRVSEGHLRTRGISLIYCNLQILQPRLLSAPPPGRASQQYTQRREGGRD